MRPSRQWLPNRFSCRFQLQLCSQLEQWFNYHLKKSGNGNRVKNFTTDIQDSVSYAILLRQIAPEIVSPEEVKEIQVEADLMLRAQKVIALSRKVLGDEFSVFVSAADIVQGNPRLNLAFTANLFNSHPGM
jgi:hypothetical protein